MANDTHMRIARGGAMLILWWQWANQDERLDLCGADLSGVDLSDAMLVGSDLSEVNLSGANLREANHAVVNLSGANLREANLTGAYLNATIFVDVDLSSATGLDSCFHLGPYPLDQRTLAKSGPLPRVFLESCGVPES